MGIHFRRNVQERNAVRQLNANANANAAAPLSISVGAPHSRATYNLQHHIICWAALLLVALLYLHIGHRVSFEPTAFYIPRLFWRSIAAEIAATITGIALWCHGILEKFEV